MINLEIKNNNNYRNISGIYKISINDKFYIGSSNSIGRRLNHHLWSLIKNNHHNKTIQNYWNKYKLASFEIIEICDIDILIEREKFYIDNLKPYMNHILDPVNIKRDDIYKKRLSEGAKKSFKNGRKVVNKQLVHMYELMTGKYIKTFNSITEASLNFNHNGDASAISAVLNGRAYTAYSHYWSTEKFDIINISKKKYKLRKIQQYKDNILIKEWESVTDAQQTLNIKNITRAASKNRTAGGFYWKYV